MPTVETIEPVTHLAPQGNIADSQEPDAPATDTAPAVSDLAERFAKLQAEYGRQSNEVGELRAVVRRLIEAQEAKSAVASPSSDPLLRDALGDEAARAVEARIAQLEKQLAEARDAALRAQFAQVHPDYEKIVASPDFAEWVNAKPARQRLFERADRGDLDAADELLTLYKDARKAPAIPPALKSERPGSSAPPRKKVWTSVEIGKLYLENPNEYYRLSDEIAAAYREGRVK